MKEKRKIAIIIGSKSDLNQCWRGLRLLQDSDVDVIGVYVRSQHRNMRLVQELILDLYTKVDVAIVGAGWANHLTGCVDAYLRYEIKTVRIPIIGVAFEDIKNNRHTEAAMLSISEVPGTQVVYRDDKGEFIGEEGFLRACGFAINKPLPEIKLPEPKSPLDFTLEEAIREAVK